MTTTAVDTPTEPAEVAEPQRTLTPEAKRALAEAEARRNTAVQAGRPPEIGGRTGPDPVRYGDWEIGGITSDF